VRPALAPTAAADVLAGAAFAGGAPLGPLLGATFSSVCLYAAGMGLNDLRDRRRDATLHPGRPLVARPDLVPHARVLVAALLVAGLGAAAAAGVLLPALAVAALAALYDLWLKEHFPWDALALGSARAANLAIGLSVARGWDTTYVLAYLLYVGGVTVASRAEDLEPASRRRRMLALSLPPVLLAHGGLASLASRWAALLVPLALVAASLAVALLAATRRAVMRHVLVCLLAIFALHAAVLGGSGRAAAIVPVAACAAASLLLLAVQSRSGAS
jgi:4-hydroxybenzoate polyprenyltransferase